MVSVGRCIGVQGRQVLKYLRNHKLWLRRDARSNRMRYRGMLEATCVPFQRGGELSLGQIRA
jgi:hypothetical protein